MSGGEDKSRKTEQPTKHKLDEVRKKGQVPKSKDIISTVVIIALFAYIWIFWHHNLALVKELFLNSWALIDKPFDYAMVTMMDHTLMVFLKIVAPAILISIIAVVLANVGQFGFLFSVEPIKPTFEKINPVAGFKRIFGAKNIVETLKSIVKIILISISIYWITKLNIPELMEIVYCDVECGHTIGRRIVMYISLLCILLFIALSIFDRWFQKFQHIKDNKMTMEELKRDHKSTEGDPMIKQRRKSLQQEEARKGSIAERVQQVTAIIVSGQYAIGLFYEQGQTPLPLVSFMEKEAMATNLVNEAKKHEVPVFVEDDLVQELWVKAKPEQYLPTLSPERVNEVAKVIVQAMRAKMGM